MASVFTRIIQGELPGVFVWRDDECVALLSIEPMQPGHTLVVPRLEIDHWIDLDPELARHVFGVAQVIGRAQQRAFSPLRVGVMVLGVDVPHVHVHVTPVNRAGDLSFANVDHHPAPGALEAAAARIRGALVDMGEPGVSG